ncbi:MAG: hypothetical protein OXU26_02605 [Acidobacteriota bacterium]|nr:hypothetical protein [Acidobacteriota bacterium]
MKFYRWTLGIVNRSFRRQAVEKAATFLRSAGLSKRVSVPGVVRECRRGPSTFQVGPARQSFL